MKCRWILFWESKMLLLNRIENVFFLFFYELQLTIWILTTNILFIAANQVLKCKVSVLKINGSHTNHRSFHIFSRMHWNHKNNKYKAFKQRIYEVKVCATRYCLKYQQNGSYKSNWIGIWIYSKWVDQSNWSMVCATNYISLLN